MREAAGRRGRRRTCRAVVVAAALVCLIAPAPAPGALARPADPVVMTGAQLGGLQGRPPGSIVAFRWAGGWQQVPVQVDERATIDIRKPYNDGRTEGVPILAYTDAGTYTGADPDAPFDADDEAVVMARDTGDQAPPFAAPSGVLPATGVEARVTDPLSGDAGYVYLFQRSGSLDPAAGQQYVDYDFNLLAGTYPADYNIQNGPNPENTLLVTPFYAHHFSDRWIDDQLKVTVGAATGVDILDRHKFMFAPGECLRSEDTFSQGEGAFVTNKAGPIRAIRSYMGANSGPFTQREHVFYERRQDIRTFLRVHAIGGGMDLFDYAPAASGMTYRHEFAPGGVPVDGVPDSPPPGQITWETIDGPQGGLSMAYVTDTDIAGWTYSSYYLDKQNPGGGAERQCTGDTTAYGVSGPWINHGIPNTDPTLGPASRLATTRHLYYEAPGQANGPARKAQASAPLQVTAGGLPDGYPRPRGATPVRAALVPAFASCTSPNRTHGPPLAFGSCNPPAQESGHLTVGTPDANGAAAASTGFVRWQVLAGDPGTPADEADVRLTVSIGDVRERTGLADYGGELEAVAGLRITDRDAGTPSTVQDTPFSFAVPCAATPAQAPGSVCSITTTADTVLPGAVREGARAIWALDALRLNDGGADGDAQTAPNTPFARQGVFIP